MNYVFHLLALLLGAVAVVSEQTGIFSRPPVSGPNQNYTSNEIWEEGSIQQLQWFSTENSYNITLWQENLTANNARMSMSSIYCKMTISKAFFLL
jgi:hypothetical protein